MEITWCPILKARSKSRKNQIKHQLHQLTCLQLHINVKKTISLYQKTLDRFTYKSSKDMFLVRLSHPVGQQNNYRNKNAKITNIKKQF